MPNCHFIFIIFKKINVDLIGNCLSFFNFAQTKKYLKMKNRILTLWVLTAMTFVGCKNDKTEADAAADAATISQEAVTYTVDATASMVEWVGSKPAGKHNGTISVSGGEVMVKEGVIEGGNFTLDMNSITVLDLAAGEGKEDLEGHLKGTTKENEDHFFNVAKFPTATFEVTSIAGDATTATISGNLTMKGITKNVSFPALVTVEDASVTIKSESFKINRVDWQVNYASKSIFDDLKDKFVDDEIELIVTVKATK